MRIKIRLHTEIATFGNVYNKIQYLSQYFTHMY